MTKLIRYRNILLVLICGNILCSLFPFPPFVWRIGILVVCFLLLIKHRGITFDLFEKGCLWLLYLNVFYFLSSFIWSDPTPTMFLDFSVSLMGFLGFSILADHKVLTEKFVFLSMALLTICSIPNFFYLAQMQVTDLGKDEGAFTNNASTLFLWILPLPLILYRKIWSVVVLAVCVFFFLLGAKRGNIIASVPTLLLYVVFLLKGKEVSKTAKFIVFVGLIIICWSAYNFILTDEYFQFRIEQTMEGKTSGRDNLYSSFWNMWLDADNPINSIFGWGYDGANLSSIKSMAHSDWLEFLIDYGLFGVLIYAVLIISIFIKIINSVSKEVTIFFISILSIWILKSIYSMCIIDPLFTMMAISYAYVNQLNNKERSFRDLL